MMAMFGWTDPKMPAGGWWAIKSGPMELQVRAGPQPERSLTILDERTDDIERQVKLAGAVFGLAPSDFIRVLEKRRRFSNAVPILRQIRAYRLFE